MAPLANDTDLPIESSIPEIRRGLETDGAAVVVAPPGSGKTTVVPLRLLDEPWLAGQRILVLEPRRLATRAAARRMAELIGEDVGGTVGFVTRTDRRLGSSTRIEVITEGILTRRLQRDPELPGVGLVIFDELHERNLQTDLGLALSLDVRAALRPDLRILVMSATIDATKVAALIGGQDPAPIVTSEDRSFPIDVIWEPPARRARLEDHTAATVRRALRAETGDVLVFLPGMRSIMRCRDSLRHLGDGVDIRLLHGSLATEDQDAALRPAPPGRRKVVLSTDIAETSLTVEGVRVVIDSGQARAPRLDLRHGMTRLQTIAISKASADQRAGRAGRTEPGVAYRLWSKLEHAGRRPHIDPEITQVDLAGFALELAMWGTPEPGTLRFLDQPPPKAYRAARDLLKLLGVLDSEGQLTATAAAMAHLPLHPRLARMVADAGDDGALACVVAALLEDRDVLHGHPDDVPVDLAIRVGLVADPTKRHPAASGRSVQRARRAAEELRRRARIPDGPVQTDHAGRVLALAFPDRLAVRRGTPGRFQLRTGTTAWMAATDLLAIEQFLVPADLDGKRKDARIRVAAPLDADEVAAGFAHEVSESAALEWEGDLLWEVRRRKLGGLSLDQRRRRPGPSSEVTAELVRKLCADDLRALPWTAAAGSYRARVQLLHDRLGAPWPDFSIEALVAGVDEWLVPYLGRPTGIDDVQGIDVLQLLRNHVGYPEAAEVDRLVPREVEIPSGRRVAVDYSGEVPTVSARVQEFFGATAGPKVGGEPVVLVLLSPADRPVQITSDLGGFWAGSWSDVRKDMAGRYPKHRWPENPLEEAPGRR
jgi:ATP-dependent helicase HrpB